MTHFNQLVISPFVTCMSFLAVLSVSAVPMYMYMITIRVCFSSLCGDINRVWNCKEYKQIKAIPIPFQEHVSPP